MATALILLTFRRSRWRRARLSGRARRGTGP